ncbi:MAG: 4Fe-4S cluster-binding domain-containing protein [Gammaproteobacteria bacterium]|nr:4Fe-4S cluster-binding domain-containing protein [Gammaproteobacteria bacterium]
MSFPLPASPFAVLRRHCSRLEPGWRIGLWLQGCALACPGCVAQATTRNR